MLPYRAMENDLDWPFEFKKHKILKLLAFDIDYFSFPRNIIPKSPNSQVLKYWQRLIDVRAAAAMYENHNKKNSNKFSEIKAAYDEKAAVVFDIYSSCQLALMLPYFVRRH